MIHGSFRTQSHWPLGTAVCRQLLGMLVLWHRPQTSFSPLFLQPVWKRRRGELGRNLWMTVALKAPKSLRFLYHTEQYACTSTIDNYSTKLTIQKLLSSLCALVIIASAIPIPSCLVSLQTLAGLQEVSVLLQYAIMQVSVRLAFVELVDCAIAREGARAVAEWTSPGLGEPRPWLYRVVLGSTVPADAVLDPRLPHWSFFSQPGFITLELHRNATVMVIIVESDFPDSIPHDIRIWTLVPKSEPGLCRPRSPGVPSFPYQSEDQGLSPLFLGDAVFQAGSTPWKHRYHVPRGCNAYVPIGVVMLEFLSNGGDNITRIHLIRILGIPS